MSTKNGHASRTLDQTTSRRTFLKSFAAGAATSALLVTGGVANAARPLPNREAGNAPVFGNVVTFRGASDSRAAQKRIERRLPE